MWLDKTLFLSLKQKQRRKDSFMDTSNLFVYNTQLKRAKKKITTKTHYKI